MKVQPNVWRSKLTREDWDFSRCPSDELQWCFVWEFEREKVQLLAGGTLPKLPAQPSMVEIILASASGKLLPKAPFGFSHNADFPQLSYWEHRTKEKWKRIETEKSTKPHFMDADLIKILWSHDLCEAIRKDRCALWNDCELVALQIPWNRRDEFLVECFRDLLKEHRPKGEPGDTRPAIKEPSPLPKQPTGAGSKTRQWRKKLKALGAWRLLQHYGGINFDAFEHPGASEVLGKQFGLSGAWSEAKATVREVLKIGRLFF